MSASDDGKADSEPEYVETSSLSEYESNSSEQSENGSEDLGVEQSADDLIESQIEGDFDRLIGAIKGADDVASTAMLRKIWDVPMNAEDAEEQFQADLRAASGVGKRRTKGKRGGRRPGLYPVLSHQVRALIGEGNAAYVDGNLQEAVQKMTEVIRIEPRAAPAWTVLATCYREMNEPLRALNVSVLGAHLRHDPDEWHELARQSKDAGFTQQALYCLSKTMRLDPDNFDAIWERAALAKEVGDLPDARNAYLAMLKRFPHDRVIITELRHILIELGDLKLCAKLYQEAFDHFSQIHPEGKVPEPMSAMIDPALTADGGAVPTTPLASSGGFTFMDVLVLADLYNSLGWHDRTIRTIRVGCRWLQGRAKQKYWDTCPDDREYDAAGYIRDDSGNGVAIKQGFYVLDVNARQRLAIARLKIGDVDEGRMHANIVLQEDIADFAPLSLEIADTFFERNMYSEARPIYEMLGSDATTSSVHVLLQAAECKRNLGDTNEAQEIYEHIINVDPTNDDAKMKLAEIYEAMGHPRKALELVYQVIDSRKKKDDPAQDGTASEEEAGSATALFAYKRKGKTKTGPKKPCITMSRAELERAKEEETAVWYKRVQQLQNGMRRGETAAEIEWLTNAEKLIETFRETRSLFVARASKKPFRGVILSRKGRKRNNEQEMATRLEMELEHEKEEREAKKGEREPSGDVLQFRGIHFDKWLSLAMEYAFLLTRRDQFDVAEDVLRHLMYSTIFSNSRYQDTLRLTLATCAVHARKFEITTEMFRKLMLIYQFNNEVVRLFLASLASGLSQTDIFINPTLQKFILRELRTHANALEGKAFWLAATRRFTTASTAAEKQNAEDVGDDDDVRDDVPERTKESDNGDSARPTRSNPVLPMLYGQSLSLAKNYQGSLFYLLHAYDYFPDDPMLCMILALASLGRAMQRQSDNRNFLITQAMAFMAKYRTLRGPKDDDPYADEIEYNFGRAFHQIGLLSHAVKHYERVLKIVEKRQASNRDYVGVSREAAYNLCLIYVTTGATPFAKTITQRWLSI